MIEFVVYGMPAPQGSKKFVGMNKAGRGRNTRPKQELRGEVVGTFVVRGKRITIAPPMPSRFAAEDAPAAIDASQARPWAAAVAAQIGMGA